MDGITTNECHVTRIRPELIIVESVASHDGMDDDRWKITLEKLSHLLPSFEIE